MNLDLCGRKKRKMPIYEYLCQKCGHRLEIMQKMSDKPLSKCPECKGKLEKIISQTSFQLKGAGWYVSEYGNRAKTEKTEKPEKGEKTDKTDKKESGAACAATGGACATGNCDN